MSMQNRRDSAAEVQFRSGSQTFHIGSVSEAAVALLPCRLYEDTNLGQHFDCAGCGRFARLEQLHRRCDGHNRMTRKSLEQPES
jgi:hypothetical protein